MSSNPIIYPSLITDLVFLRKCAQKRANEWMFSDQ